MPIFKINETQLSFFHNRYQALEVYAIIKKEHLFVANWKGLELEAVTLFYGDLTMTVIIYIDKENISLIAYYKLFGEVRVHRGIFLKIPLRGGSNIKLINN